jgi:hypothetical protein
MTADMTVIESIDLENTDTVQDVLKEITEKTEVIGPMNKKEEIRGVKETKTRKEKILENAPEKTKEKQIVKNRVPYLRNANLKIRHLLQMLEPSN